MMIWQITTLLFMIWINDAVSFSDTVQSIIERAKADGIDLESQPWASAAFSEVDQLENASIIEPQKLKNADRIDVHCHAVPKFYFDIMPIKPNPWTVQNHLEHMANLSIAHTVLSIPWPGASIYSGNETATIALARIINEYMSAVARKLPKRFSFFATAPLPYPAAALKETQYALDHLGASGIGLFSNHEGRYLGNPELQPFFAGLDSQGSQKKAIFVHPAMPTCRPAFSASQTEFYWDTAQAILGMTLTQTLHNFSSLEYIFSHGGGAFPSIWDRAFVNERPEFKTRSEGIYRTRLWWDSAGATYPRQIQGLLAYDVPKSQLVYGTDFPFNVGPYAEAAQAVAQASFLSKSEKTGVFRTNALDLLPGIKQDA